MKRLCCLMCIIPILLSFVSCTVGGRKNQRLGDDEVEKRAEDFVGVIINAIVDYDEQHFNSLFTDEALKSPHFEKGKDYLFEIFEGEVLSVEQKNIIYADGISKYGRSYKPSVSYYLNTDRNKYVLYVNFYLDGYNTHTGKHYTNKIMRLRLARESDLSGSGYFNRNGGMGSLEGIYHPGIVLDEYGNDIGGQKDSSDNS